MQYKYRAESGSELADEACTVGGLDLRLVASAAGPVFVPKRNMNRWFLHLITGRS